LKGTSVPACRDVMPRAALDRCGAASEILGFTTHQ
jgi:cobalamin biosynthesis protein CobT